MIERNTMWATALLAAFVMPIASAEAFDDAQYPDWHGQWARMRSPPGVTGQPSFDPSKSWGRAQQAPLTPEYQAIFEANLVDQANGGFGTTAGWNCLTSGLPLMMTLFEPMEVVIMPDTTYILIDQHNTQRRIYTDGRDWPAEIEPSYIGYSIGKWIDTVGDGRYDVLEVETRGFKEGLRTYGGDGLPLHPDGKRIIKERFYTDKADPNVMHDEITVIDHALTRPWTAIKNYHREGGERPLWREWICQDGQGHVSIGKENYFLSAEGLLMPSKKGQAPPNLKYFKQSQK